MTTKPTAEERDDLHKALDQILASPHDYLKMAIRTALEALNQLQK